MALALALALAAAGCSDAGDGATPPPARGALDIIVAQDGLTYAGAAVVDITPEVGERFTDLDEDGTFDGCLDDPTAAREGCDEPFEDANENGRFDPVFIAGYGPMRPAQDVHDPITARALVLSHGGEYLALVALDLVGLASTRIHAARDRLVEDGFDRDRLLVAATHNHEGPDSMGLWGDPENFADPTSGLDMAYQERITDAIEQAVREAAAAMEAVTFHVGAVRMRDRDPYFNGEHFGGRNRTPKMHGMIHDIRDPVIVSDQLLVMQGRRSDGDAVFTFTNWSGHPEVWGDTNDALSADWVGVTRTLLEAEYGGVAIHMPECLGGMQSAGGGDVPLIDEAGAPVVQTCDEAAVADQADVGCHGKEAGAQRTDEDGRPVPEWAEDETWEFVRSHGHHIAEAAKAVLADAPAREPTPIRVEVEALYVPITNLGFQMLGGMNIFDLDLNAGVKDTELCPEASSVQLGCMPLRTFRVTLGPIGFVTAPGELLPELAWGLPTDDERWSSQGAATDTRGDGSAYFPQHDADCDAVGWAACSSAEAKGECNCLSVHAWPYALSTGEDQRPLLDLLDTEYRAILGMVDDYGGYIVPKPDFNTQVSLLTDDGDHYEDTVSLSYEFGERLLAAQRRIATRW